MKKYTLILLCAFTCVSVFAQDSNEQSEENQLENNEFRLNVGYLLAGLPEVSYERILNDESSIGISMAVSIDNDIDLNFIASPFYRFYFGKKRAAGFFLEGHGAVYSEDTFEGSETRAGLGIALGGKFLTKSNWTGELLFGLGRTLINNDDDSEVYPRLGVSIGKRF